MTADLREGTELAGFRIQALVARGGMGVVYRATQLSLERQVALKVMAPEFSTEDEFRTRFLREVRIAASLDHPHVLPVYETGESDGVLYLAMRYVEGESLADVLARESPLDPARAVAIVSQVAEALEAAHAAGLVHRDVKPANVLLTGEGAREHAYLCDFGLARRWESATELTHAGGFVGSIPYAAPEQIRGEPVDARTDVYSLGCLLFECLTGKLPFVKEHEAAVLWAHLNEPVPVPSESRPELGETFDGIVERALAKDPGERLQTVSELAAALVSDTPLARRATSAGASVNLPRSTTSFLGRSSELREIAALLTSVEVRILTLTGPGGAGKTRLAIEAARRVADRFPDGVFWVPLAPLGDSSLVPTTVAHFVGVDEQPGVPIVDTIANEFAAKSALLVLDNCEHLVDAVASLARRLVERCPHVGLLASSRERLGLGAERVLVVPPMAPKEGEALFAERARVVDASFEPDEHVPEICAAVDNLPLAVELAAARVRSLSTRSIRERLGERLSLLASRDRDVDDRQRTLEATIAWSYELLDDEEQRALCALSIFAGGCTLDAAEEVAGADLDVLEMLIEKSLLRHRVDEAGMDRYWMLETIREFAAGAMQSASEFEQGVRAHIDYFVGFARQFDSIPGRGATAEELAAFQADRPNLRLALRRAIDAEDAPSALRLVRYLGWFWYWLRELADSYAVARAALALDGGAELDRAYALSTAAKLAGELGEIEQAKAMLTNAEQLLARADDLRGLALNDNYRSFLEYLLGNYFEAIEAAERSIERAREAGDRELEISAGAQLSSALQASALEEDVPDRSSLERSRELDEVKLAWDRAHGSPLHEANSLSNLAFTLYLLGECREALRHAQDSLRIQLRSGKQQVSGDLLNIGCIAVGLGMHRDGVRLVSSALRDYEREGIILQAIDHRVLQRAEAAARDDLGVGYDDAVLEGKGLAHDRAVELALSLPARD